MLQSGIVKRREDKSWAGLKLGVIREHHHGPLISRILNPRNIKLALINRSFRATASIRPLVCVCVCGVFPSLWTMYEYSSFGAATAAFPKDFSTHNADPWIFVIRIYPWASGPTICNPSRNRPQCYAGQGNRRFRGNPFFLDNPLQSDCNDKIIITTN